MKKLQTGTIATGKDFLGRSTILKEIETYLGINQSVVLIAPRRYGKSSIIKKITDTNTFGYKIISVDIMGIHSKRLLAEHIINEVYSTIGVHGILSKIKDLSITFFKDLTNHLTSLKISIEDLSIETTGKLLRETNEDKLLEHALNLPNKIATKLHIKFLFVIDEFGELDKLQSKTELIDTMRTIFQKQENITFLFAGSQYALMTKIFINKSSAFHKFVVSIEVPKMEACDFEKTFYDVFYSRHISTPSNFAQEIERLSSGIPYYMVRLAQQVLVDAVLSEKINTHCFSIRRAAIKVYYKEQGYFASELSKFRGKKHDMTALIAMSNDENHTLALAEQGVTRQNANSIAKSLLLTGIIHKKEKYEIIDPFLRRYIKKL
ncbi:MAG: AAA+ ATPase superfamily predicted ATPase [Sulfurimonas sp.]|jgi:AAA+ ATPase superfamily predicted ATPase